MGTMKAGDANNSDNVNIVDFNMVKAAFGTGVGGPGYDDRANFNRDGAVNATDFNLLTADSTGSLAPAVSARASSTSVGPSSGYWAISVPSSRPAARKRPCSNSASASS